MYLSRFLPDNFDTHTMGSSLYGNISLLYQIASVTIVSFGPHFFALSSYEGMGPTVSGALSGVICADKRVLINKTNTNINFPAGICGSDCAIMAYYRL